MKNRHGDNVCLSFATIDLYGSCYVNGSLRFSVKQRNRGVYTGNVPNFTVFGRNFPRLPCLAITVRATTKLFEEQHYIHQGRPNGRCIGTIDNNKKKTFSMKINLQSEVYF